MGWTAQRKTGQRICRLDEAIRAAKENSDCHYEAKSAVDKLQVLNLSIQ